jgi:hypothetical protein
LKKLARTIHPTTLPTNEGFSKSAWASIHGSLNYYNNHLQIQPTTHLKEEMVINNQMDLTVNTELNSIIKRFEEVYIFDYSFCLGR